MEEVKIFVLNDEGEDIQLEESIIAQAFASADRKPVLQYIHAAACEDEQQMNERLKDAEGIISVYTEFDRERLQKLKNCKVIATQTIGVNTIDLEAASDLGICVCNVPDYCVEEVATHTAALALACARKIVRYDEIAKEKLWDLEDIYRCGEVHRMQGQTYGLISFGNIAKKVGQIMKGFGMNVMAYDPFLPAEVFQAQGVQRADTLEQLFEACNIISVHTPLLKSTQGMINYDLMKRMPKGGILINTSRGGTVNEDDLYQALCDGTLAGCGIDVITDETNFETKLYALDNVTVTPHIAYYSEEALKECRVKAAEQVGSVLGKRQVPKYLVNKGVIGKTKCALGQRA